MTLTPVEIPAGATSGEVIAISGNAGAIIGSGSGGQGWIWDATLGPRLLSPGPCGSEAYAISADGSVVTGRICNDAGIWTQATGMLSLGGPSVGLAVAIDENSQALIWGFNYTENRPFLWAADAGYQLQVTGIRFPKALSNNGKAVLFQKPNQSGFTWQNGNEAFANVSGPNMTVASISGNGAVVVGTQSGVGWFRWDQECGVVALPTVEGTMSSSAQGATFDGWTIVGHNTTSNDEEQAVIWSPRHGPRLIRDVMLDAQVDLSEWNRLYLAVDVSDDGTVVVGNGFTSGDSLTARAWRATLPQIPPCMKGDVDVDGAVTVGDVAVMAGILLEPCAYGLESRCAADINGDNFIDGDDLGPFIELLTIDR
ncbi:MAG: hypothetical protein H6819_04820 [Phycisphaerales bacterium]|nr:hypothetical protein [Phycisphaerales bacterium]MCB9856523.1 hypothetical protein [Phycisphaerales bacterium]